MNQTELIQIPNHTLPISCASTKKFIKYVQCTQVTNKQNTSFKNRCRFSTKSISDVNRCIYITKTMERGVNVESTVARDCCRCHLVEDMIQDIQAVEGVDSRPAELVQDTHLVEIVDSRLAESVEDTQLAETVDNHLAESADSFRVQCLGDSQQQRLCWVDNSYQALAGNFQGHCSVDSHLQHLELVDSLRAEWWDSPDRHQAETVVETGPTTTNKTFPIFAHDITQHTHVWTFYSETVGYHNSVTIIHTFLYRHNVITSPSRNKLIIWQVKNQIKSPLAKKIRPLLLRGLRDELLSPSSFINQWTNRSINRSIKETLDAWPTQSQASVAIQKSNQWDGICHCNNQLKTHFFWIAFFLFHSPRTRAPLNWNPCYGG